MDHAKRGAQALNDKKYPEAIEAYTAALKSSPTSPDYFIKRSTAYQRSSPPDYASALSDAEHGVIYAQKRARRELITQAQLRRAIALFGLERYGDADFVLAIVKRLDEKEKSVALWENKIKMKLAGLAEGDPKGQLLVKETPDLSASVGIDSNAGKSSNNTTQAAPAPVAALPPSQTPANKIRHDWYQTNDTIIFTLLAKGVPKDKAVIGIQQGSLSITFPLVTGSTYEFSLDPLYAAVDPDQSKYNVFSTKIEVTLRKQQTGQKWHALEGDGPVTSETPQTAPVPSHIKDHLSASSAIAAPSYPTSSRSGPKNWDKLADDLTAKKPKKDGEDKSAGNGKGDDDDDWDYDKEEGDEVNGFFKKLYKDASPDVRRAMMKSFTESNGTALSTNWSEVSKGPVETSPPDSMVAKKWGE